VKKKETKAPSITVKRLHAREKTGRRTPRREVFSLSKEGVKKRKTAGKNKRDSSEKILPAKEGLRFKDTSCQIPCLGLGERHRVCLSGAFAWQPPQCLPEDS